jgi:hypothetical protein
MLALTPLVLALTLNASVQDFLEGAEIGDAVGYIALESKGGYHAERADKAAGKTVLAGKWELKDDTLAVKVASCSGPACKQLKINYTAHVEVKAERAITVRSTPADSMFPSGAYYCHYQGCERRAGVELVSKDAKARTLNTLVDFLIDKNRKRDVTVVWWGKKLQADAGASRIEFCALKPEAAKKTAELVAGDLAELSDLGTLPIGPSAEPDCLWDVRVFIADGVTVPGRAR